MEINILTERAYQKWASWNVVYEWEDNMHQIMQYPIIDLYGTAFPELRKKIRKLMRKLNLGRDDFMVKQGYPWKLMWIMDAKIYKEYNYENVIPIFLDFSVESIPSILRATSKLPCFWVTCLDIYDRLVLSGAKNVYYQPLSISDKYINSLIPKKSIDVIQFGRKNEILHQFMMDYAKRHQQVEYVYQLGDGTLTYNSTTRGNIGKFDNRTEYMSLMSKCKVSLVSTPGCDKSKNFGGIDFFTPRFYESAAQYCHMIGRFTENKEATQICVKEVCCNVSSKDQFDTTLDRMLATDNRENLILYKEFLSNNVTSKRSNDMKKILQEVL